MGIDAISGISSYNTSAVSAVSMKNGGLSEETIKKLKALGIDPTKVKSESEAQALIAKAQNGQKSQSIAQINIPQESTVDVYKLKTDIKDLSKKVGVDVSSSKTFEEAVNKLEVGVNEYTKATSGQANAAISTKKIQNNDVHVKPKKEDIQIEFKDIKHRVDEAKNAKNAMFAGQDMMSVLNRMSLGI